MVRPHDFGFNEQTGLDNEFQHRPSKVEQTSLRKTVFDEFDNSIAQLESVGIEVLVLEKQHSEKRLPDAIFPNNWFSTRENGELIIYPMKTQNRQDEVQIPQLCDLLENAHYNISQVSDLREQLSTDKVLEGTGSLIFHHPSHRVFAAISERCQKQPLAEYCDKYHYQSIDFETASSNNSPIYHSNVLMSCGENFAVLCDQVVTGKNRKVLLNGLLECVDDLIIISEDQMSSNFCGNILQLKDANQQPVIAMSKSAYDGFSLQQKKRLENHGSLAICEIPTIERIGGGSTRCMLAENFLNKN